MFRHAKPNIGSARKNTGAVFATLAAGVLAGCAGDADPDAAEGCPRVAVVADAALVEQFRPGPGRDLTDLTTRAQIREISGGCWYDENGVTVEVELPIVAERGPAMTGSEVDLEYFVAVTDPEWNLVAKQDFTLRLRFEPGAGFAASRETVEQVIPLQSQRQAGFYQILIGFALDREQLGRNLAN